MRKRFLLLMRSEYNAERGVVKYWQVARLYVITTWTRPSSRMAPWDNVHNSVQMCKTSQKKKKAL